MNYILYIIDIMVDIQIKKFDMSQMKGNQNSIIIGKRAVGKSTLVKYLLQNRYDNSLQKDVITESEYTHKFYENIDTNIKLYDNFGSYFSNYNFLVIDNCMNSSKIIVFDNAIFDYRSLNNKWIRNLIINKKTLKTSTIMTFQYPIGISPDKRANIDYIFIFKDNNLSYREELYKQYCGIISTYEAFSLIMNQLQDHECLVIDNYSTSNKIEDVIYWYKVNMERDKQININKEITEEVNEEINEEINNEMNEEINEDMNKTLLEEKVKSSTCIMV